MELILFLVSLLASIVGTICGIGGGVIIKPVLDIFKLMDVSAITFLSGSTVLTMSLYSVGSSLGNKGNTIKTRTTIPLAIGATLGGVAGRYLFATTVELFENDSTVSAVQAVFLFIATLCVLLYTLNKKKIKSLRVDRELVCIVIGLALGLTSSFLGIGGGPLNLVVLHFFFSMDIKTAVNNSLFIILFSQLAYVLTVLTTGTVPVYKLHYLIFMAAGGICGGILGQRLNKRMSSASIDRLFTGLLCFIMLICLHNAWHYA